MTVILILCWSFVRNANIYKIRIKFLAMRHDAYDSLPSYDEMLFELD